MNKITEIKINKLVPLLKEHYKGTLHIQTFEDYLLVSDNSTGTSFGFKFDELTTPTIQSLINKISNQLNVGYGSIDMLQRYKKK